MLSTAQLCLSLSVAPLAARSGKSFERHRSFALCCNTSLHSGRSLDTKQMSICGMPFDADFPGIDCVVFPSQSSDLSVSSALSAKENVKEPETCARVVRHSRNQCGLQEQRPQQNSFEEGTVSSFKMGQDSLG